MIATAPRRGRPARLSQASWIDAALVLLERDPTTVPTVARIAALVSAVPAALYRHFESQDELFDAVLARVLAAHAIEPDPEAPWEAQLATWMRGLRAHLVRFPAVFSMIGRSGRTSPAWLDASSALVAILARTGLEEKRLTSAYLWILESTVGLVWQEALMPLPEQIENARHARHELAESARARFGPLLPHFAAYQRDELFDFTVERTIEAVARLAQSSNAGQPELRRIEPATDPAIDPAKE